MVIGSHMLAISAFCFGLVFSSDSSLYMTDATFKDVIGQYDVALVLFMAPLCSPCKKIITKLEWVTKQLVGNPYKIHVGFVNCYNTGRKVCQRYSVTGYPTVKLFKAGDYWKEYDGSQEEQGILQYIVDHARPCPAALDTEQKLEHLSSDGNVYVAFYRKGVHDSALKNIFLSAAKEQRGYTRMGFSENPEMIKKYCPNQGVVFFRDQRLRNKLEPDTIVYDGNDTKIALEEWMSRVKHGLVGIRAPENNREFKMPLVVTYFSLNMGRRIKYTQYVRNKVLKVAKKFKNVNFAISDKSLFENDFFQFGYNFFPIDPMPIVLAKNERGKYRMDGNFSVSALTEFVRAMSTNRLTAFVRSQKPPAKNNGVVKIVVADTFLDLVDDSRRDSFIMLTSEDCELCKKVKGLWKRVGQAMKGESVDILRMDVGRNDRPSQYRLYGMPTLYWVPKNDKKNPIRYTGHLEYFELIEFIAKMVTDELLSRDRKGRHRKDEL